MWDSLKKQALKLFEVKKDKDGKAKLSKFQESAINFVYGELKQQTPFLEGKLKGLINWLRNTVAQQEQKRKNKVGIIAYYDEVAQDFVFEIRDISIQSLNSEDNSLASIEVGNKVVSRHRGIKIIGDVVTRLKKSRDWQHLQELMKEDIFANEVSTFEYAEYTQVSQEEVQQKVKEKHIPEIKAIPTIKLLDIKK